MKKTIVLVIVVTLVFFPMISPCLSFQTEEEQQPKKELRERNRNSIKIRTYIKIRGTVIVGVPHVIIKLESNEDSSTRFGFTNYAGYNTFRLLPTDETYTVTTIKNGYKSKTINVEFDKINLIVMEI